jgi:hypothetical protein
MNRLLIVAAFVVGMACGTSELTTSHNEGSKASQDELNVGACFNATGDPADFLDGGFERLEACLADAGFGVPPTPPTPPVPPVPGFDGGFPGGGGGGFPGFDAGGFGGFPGGGGFPGFDAGFGGLPGGGGFPGFDGGFGGGTGGVPAGLLDPCSASCTCPNGLTCLNPLNQTCPGTLTLCVP